MSKDDIAKFIDKILEQQAVINQQTEKIRYLEMVIDTLTAELQRARMTRKS